MRLPRTFTDSGKHPQTTNFFVTGPKFSLDVLRVHLALNFTRASNFIRLRVLQGKLQRIGNTSPSTLSPRLAFMSDLRSYSRMYTQTVNFIRSRMLQKTSQSGFTLVEALVVMGILSMLGGLGLFLNLDTYRSLMFRSERDTLISAILKARSQSMNNICIGAGCTDGKPHGVFITKGKYVIFQGQSYASRDTAIDEALYAQNDTVGFTSPSYEIVFAQLSGSVATPIDIGFNDGAMHYSTTSINTEGRVSWTN